MSPRRSPLRNIGGDDQNVAGLRVLDRCVRREVVARPALHRQRDAAETHGARQRTHAVVERAAPSVRVNYPASGRLAQLIDKALRRAQESCGGPSMQED